MRVGFLGAGLIATYHSKSIRHSGFDVERAGVYDPDEPRAVAFAQASGHYVCHSTDEVLDDCDVAYVCSWTSEHLAIVANAVARRIPVFCEKPLATTLADAEELTRLVTEAGLINQVGLVLRYSPAFVVTRSLVHAPQAGRVMAAVFRDDQYIPIQGQYDSTWRADVTKAGSGTLLEHSIHDLDMLEFLVGPIAAVSGRSAAFHDLAGIEDAVTVSLAFEGGAVGTLASVWHDNLSRPSLRRVEIFCEHRHVVVEGDDWYGPVSWSDTDGATHTLTGDALVDAADPLIERPKNPDGAFLTAVRDGTPAYPDVHVALRAHRLVAAIYESAALGGGSVRCASSS